MTPNSSGSQYRSSQSPDSSRSPTFPEVPNGEGRHSADAIRADAIRADAIRAEGTRPVRTLLGDSEKTGDWRDPLDPTLGFQGRTRLREETGAALERQLLLSATPEDSTRIPPKQGPRWVGRIVPWLLMAGILGSGVFFFLESKKTWEARVCGLETSLETLKRDADAREGALRREGVEKDREIEERKKDADRIASLADQTLQQLKAALTDFRDLREEKLELEAQYRKLLRERKSPILEVFGRWLPEWAHRQTPGSGDGNEP